MATENVFSDLPTNVKDNDPNHADLHSNLGIALNQLKRTALGQANLSGSPTPANGLDIRRFLSGPGATPTDATLTAAIAEAGASGNDILIPATVGVSLNSPVVVTMPVRIIQAGGFLDPYHRTGLKTIRTGNFPGFITSCSGVTYQNLRIEGPAGATPTAGSQCIAIDIQQKVNFFASTGATKYNGTALPGSYQVLGCSFYNAETLVNQINGQEGIIAGNYFIKFTNFGLSLDNVLLRDGGDTPIFANQFVPETVSAIAAIFQQGGGGARISNNKCNGRDGGRVNHFYYAQYLAPPENTVINKINDNSCENTADTIIVIRGGGYFADQSILGNQFGIYNPVPNAIDISGVDGVLIEGNSFIPGATNPIKLQNCKNVSIGLNNYRGGYDNANPPAKDIDDYTKTHGLRDQDVASTGTTNGGGTVVAAETTFDDTFGPSNGTVRFYDESAGTGSIVSGNGLTMTGGPTDRVSADNNKAQYRTARTYPMGGKLFFVDLVSLTGVADENAPAFSITIGNGARTSNTRIQLAIQGGRIYAEWPADYSGIHPDIAYTSDVKCLAVQFNADATQATMLYGPNSTNLQSLGTNPCPSGMATADIYLYVGSSTSDSSVTKLSRAKLA